MLFSVLCSSIVVFKGLFVWGWGEVLQCGGISGGLLHVHTHQQEFHSHHSTRGMPGNPSRHAWEPKSFPATGIYMFLIPRVFMILVHRVFMILVPRIFMFLVPRIFLFLVPRIFMFLVPRIFMFLVPRVFMFLVPRVFMFPRVLWFSLFPRVFHVSRAS